ncbi:hypothetical protein ES702_07291 [subsurface metagenome]
MYWKSWIKKHWWKILIPFIVAIVLYARWYMKIHNEYKKLYNYVGEK